MPVHSKITAFCDTREVCTCLGLENPAVLYLDAHWQLKKEMMTLTQNSEQKKYMKNCKKERQKRSDAQNTEETVNLPT
jgi:hypothetical protein